MSKIRGSVHSIGGLLIATLFVKPSAFEIIKSLFPVTFQINWFVGCYIIYYLIHPLLNNAVKDFSRKQFLAFIIILFIAYSIIATLSPRYYFTNLVAFICIHYIVSFCKKYKIYEHDKKYDIYAIIGFSIFLISLIIGIMFVSQYVGFFKNRNLWLCRFYNPVIICLVIPAVFLAAKSHSQSFFINSISALSLFIYLIHGNYFWQAFGKYAVLDIIDSKLSSPLLDTILLFFLFFVFQLILSKFYIISFSKITDRFAENLGRKLNQWIK